MEQPSQPEAIRKPRVRLKVVLPVGGLVVVAGLLYFYFVYARPIGSGPAGPSVSRKPFAKTWTTHRVLLLGIGDSVTAGFGVDAAHSYFGRLVKNPDDEFEDMRGICLSAALPNLQTQNLALSGSTSIRHLDIVRNQLEMQDANVFGLVVMTTGGNDLIHNYGLSPPREGAMYGATFEQARPWIENFRTRLDAMVAAIEERFPGGCMIFLADIYDPTDGCGDAVSAWLPDWPEGPAIHRAYNEIIRQCAERRPTVHLVPMHDEFLGHGTHCTQPWQRHYRPGDPHYWYASNLEDPNIRGYDAIRRLFLIAIAGQADRFPAGGTPTQF